MPTAQILLVSLISPSFSPPFHKLTHFNITVHNQEFIAEQDKHGRLISETDTINGEGQR